jgi:hypothetical protein
MQYLFSNEKRNFKKKTINVCGERIADHELRVFIILQSFLQCMEISRMEDKSEHTDQCCMVLLSRNVEQTWNNRSHSHCDYPMTSCAINTPRVRFINTGTEVIKEIYRVLWAHILSAELQIYACLICRYCVHYNFFPILIDKIFTVWNKFLSIILVIILN